MMREQRGRHFDPVLLDAFMEVLGRSGPDAREQLRADPEALVESTLETFATALERGRRRDGRGSDRDRDRGRHHADDAPRRGDRARAAPLGVLSEAGRDRHRPRAPRSTITRRVLATLYRYMTGGTEPTRERVLLAGVEGDAHTLGLQMVHDQLAAAGIPDDLRHRTCRRSSLLDDGREPVARDLIVARRDGGRRAASPRGRAARAALRAHPDMPIVLGGPAVGGSLPASAAACGCSSASTSR